MIKAFLKYLLLLCIILLSAYGQLSAHAYQASTSNTPIKATIGIEATAFQEAKLNQTFISTPSPSGTAKTNHKKIVAAENEVNESDLFKKFLESSKFITAICYAFTFGFLFRHLTKGLLLCEHLVPTASYRRHLVIQVFRI